MTDIHDPRLPGLSSRDTRWLVDEARRVLADLGHSAEVLDGVALTVTDGPVVGLDNLARTLSRLPRKRWSRCVREQLSTLARARPDADVATEDVFVKLWTRERADELLTYPAIEPLPGVVAVLAARGDGFTHEFGRLDQLGDRDAAYDTALTNLAGLPLPRHTRRRADPRVPGSWVEHLHAGDPFSAARVAVLPDLLRRLGIDFPSHGVLVAVPTKHDLWVHVPTDEDVVQTALTMSRLAYRAWAEEPYPVCPDVFLVSPDMRASLLVSPEREHVDLDERAMVTLLTALAVT